MADETTVLDLSQPFTMCGPRVRSHLLRLKHQFGFLLLEAWCSSLVLLLMAMWVNYINMDFFCINGQNRISCPCSVTDWPCTLLLEVSPWSWDHPSLSCWLLSVGFLIHTNAISCWYSSEDGIPVSTTMCITGATAGVGIVSGGSELYLRSRRYTEVITDETRISKID